MGQTEGEALCKVGKSKNKTEPLRAGASESRPKPVQICDLEPCWCRCPAEVRTLVIELDPHTCPRGLRS